MCFGGCGHEWNVDRDDVHHMDYTNLGDEAFEDLWPLCRKCHNQIHALLDLREYRKLARPLANQLALGVLRRR